ncbi:unnamed protein product [Soboliphyme baturini]|uniref:EGF-like domain-containing protein n=1 Tax=Soboliphyme baturini TaxID=241478 RepID=A0A183IT48_9BILA|nr:unnamed protein product [Soboliphyme baturini]
MCPSESDVRIIYSREITNHCFVIPLPMEILPNHSLTTCEEFKRGRSASLSELVKFYPDIDLKELWRKGTPTKKFFIIEPYIVVKCVDVPHNDCHVAVREFDEKGKVVNFVGYNERGIVRRIDLYANATEKRDLANTIANYEADGVIGRYMINGTIRNEYFLGIETVMNTAPCITGKYKMCEVTCEHYQETLYCVFQITTPPEAPYGHCPNASLAGNMCMCPHCNQTVWSPWSYSKPCGMSPKYRYRPHNTHPNEKCDQPNPKCCEERATEFREPCLCKRKEMQCKNNGTCIDVSPKVRLCACIRGFAGEDCSENIDDCVNVTCSGVGTCIDGINNYTCVCGPRFTGDMCEESKKLVFS